MENRKRKLGPPTQQYCCICRFPSPDRSKICDVGIGRKNTRPLGVQEGGNLRGGQATVARSSNYLQEDSVNWLKYLDFGTHTRNEQSSFRARLVDKETLFSSMDGRMTVIIWAWNCGSNSYFDTLIRLYFPLEMRDGQHVDSFDRKTAVYLEFRIIIMLR